MNVLITGATGFVGREIVAELINQGSNVYSVGNRQPNLQNTQANFFKIDITNAAEVGRLKNIKELDVIIHSAGLAHQFGNTPKSEFWKTNVEGTKDILDLAVYSKVKHFILISSTAVYGTKKKRAGQFEIITENSATDPQTVYAESKLEAESVAACVCEKNNINLTIFRLAPVIGEQNSGNVARMIEAIDRRGFIWIGRGDNYKSLIYKKDVARACASVLKNKRDAVEVFNLAAEPILMSEFVSSTANRLGRKVPGISISPILLERMFRLNEKTLQIEKIKKLAVTIEKWLSDDVYSADKFAGAYDFKPETGVIEALEKQVASYLTKKQTSQTD